MLVAISLGVILGVVALDAGKAMRPLASGDVSRYTTQATQMTFADFATHIVPPSMLGAFTNGEMLQVVFVAVLFGMAMSALGPGLTPPAMLDHAKRPTAGHPAVGRSHRH